MDRRLDRAVQARSGLVQGQPGAGSEARIAGFLRRRHAGGPLALRRRCNSSARPEAPDLPASARSPPGGLDPSRHDSRIGLCNSAGSARPGLATGLRPLNRTSGPLPVQSMRGGHGRGTLFATITSSSGGRVALQRGRLCSNPTLCLSSAPALVTEVSLPLGHQLVDQISALLVTLKRDELTGRLPEHNPFVRAMMNYAGPEGAPVRACRGPDDCRNALGRVG